MKSSTPWRIHRPANHVYWGGLTAIVACALSISSADAVDQASFIVQSIALTSTTGIFGPQLGPVTSFTGFNGDPSISLAGDAAYPGNLSPAFNGAIQGFWLLHGAQNIPIALTNNDGPWGPGLGSGVVFGNMFHDALVGAAGEVVLGGFLSGDGVDSTNNLLYVRHEPAGNVPLARTGIANALGPGMGDGVVFTTFGAAVAVNSDSALLRAGIAGNGISPASAQGLWRNTAAGNISLARSGVEGSLGPGLGAGQTFDAFEQYRLLDGPGDVVFVGRTGNVATSTENIGLWKNTAAGNAPLAFSGVAGTLGPGLGPNVTFGISTQVPFGYTQFDVNAHGATVFSSTLSDGRRGLWRNLGQDNEPLMLVGASGALGPGVGIQDTFANWTTSTLLVSPAVNEENVVLFPGMLVNSHKQGLWLNAANGNNAIALTGDDGSLGPQLGPGITFSGFNRAYFGDDDTVYFTADLSLNVPSNRLLGLWAFRKGRIQPIVVYNELFDVDATAGIDQRLVRWVQIPSDTTWNDPHGANSSGQLVFRMGFQDGSQGIFEATPVPEPCTLALAAIGGGLLLAGRTWRRGALGKRRLILSGAISSQGCTQRKEASMA